MRQIIKFGGAIQTILECGHDVSNLDTALESGTEFCRLCDLQGRCRDAEGREKELHGQRQDEAWMHAACLTIAETGQKWGDSVKPSLAMERVYGLRKEYERLRSLLDNLCSERGAIVSSADCNEMEIAFARSENRFHVDKNGMGYVVRLRHWLTNAERAIWGVIDYSSAKGPPPVTNASDPRHVAVSVTAREIAARVWCDQEMKNCVMDVDAAESIARIIDGVRFAQSPKDDREPEQLEGWDCRADFSPTIVEKSK